VLSGHRGAQCLTGRSTRTRTGKAPQAVRGSIRLVAPSCLCVLVNSDVRQQQRGDLPGGIGGLAGVACHRAVVKLGHAVVVGHLDPNQSRAGQRMNMLPDRLFDADTPKVSALSALRLFARRSNPTLSLMNVPSYLRSASICLSCAWLLSGCDATGLALFNGMSGDEYETQAELQPLAVQHVTGLLRIKLEDVNLSRIAVHVSGLQPNRRYRITYRKASDCQQPGDWPKLPTTEPSRPVTARGVALDFYSELPVLTADRSGQIAHQEEQRATVFANFYSGSPMVFVVEDISMEGQDRKSWLACGLPKSVKVRESMFPRPRM